MTTRGMGVYKLVATYGLGPFGEGAPPEPEILRPLITVSGGLSTITTVRL